jgi:putative aldouronate transport system substrate-binding protein
VLVDHILVYYRKDWAKKLGIELGDTATYEEIADMAKAFVEKDPAGNGAGNTIGISTAPMYLCNMFVKPYNNNFSHYHKANDKYVWGPSEDSTLEGILKFKEYYDQGIIDKDFYAYKGNEYRSKFYAGLAGIMYDYGTASNFNHRISEFSRQNPDLDVDKALGYCVVLGTDKKYHGDESMNFWSASIFNPAIDDEKFSRILDVLDYASTNEAQMLINLGIKDKDYTVDGDTITITREKNEAGDFKPLIELYPSNECLYTLQILPDNFSLLDPSIPKWQRDTVVNMFKNKVEMGDNRPVDFDVEFFTGELYTKTKLTHENIVDAITAAVLSDDTKAEWNKYLSEHKDAQDAIIEELNANLIS